MPLFPSPKHRVLLVDDHPIVRAGLRSVVDAQGGLQVCAETGSAKQARELVIREEPDIAVVDLMLENDDGLLLVQEFRELRPSMQVVVVSMLDKAVYADRAKHAGAVAYFSKATGLDGFGLFLLRLAAKGEELASSDEMDESQVGGIKPLPGKVASLSNRELQVFQLIGLGRSNREVSGALGVSIKTIETHRGNIQAKLGMSTAVQLVGQAALWVRAQGLTR